MKKKPQKFTEDRQDAAIRTMAITGSIVAAADAAGVHYKTVEWYGKHDPDFSPRFKHAKLQYSRVLEAEAHRRAVDGWDEEKMGPGGLTYQVRKFSDALLLHMLKRKSPEEHGDTVKVETEIGIKNLSAESRALLRKILETEDAEGNEE